MSSLLNVAFLMLLQLVIGIQAVNHYGTCPKLLTGCFCPDGNNRSTPIGPNGTHPTPNAGNNTQLSDTCRSDNDCKVTEKCCKSGCCGFKNCVESVKDTSDQCTRANEEYRACGNSCSALTCERPRPIPIACPTVCEAGCFCKRGFLKRSDGECVRRKDCNAGK